MISNAPNYFQTIEQEFGRLRGRLTVLSPLDWELVGNWKDAGIPLRLILSEMNAAFKKKPNINTLRYFKSAVWGSFKAWRESNIGAEAETESTDQAVTNEEFDQLNLETFGRLVELYSRPNIPKPCRFVQKRLQLINPNLEFAQLEEQLQAVDRELSASILKFLSHEERDFFLEPYLSGLSKFKLTDKVCDSIVVFEYLKKNGLKKITLCLL